MVPQHVLDSAEEAMFSGVSEFKSVNEAVFVGQGNRATWSVLGNVSVVKGQRMVVDEKTKKCKATKGKFVASI